MTPDLALLLAPRPPWIVRTATVDSAAGTALAESGITVRVLNGAMMRTRTALLDEFASRLEFPDYFGHNWDALADCLTDLQWLPGFAYLLVVERSEELLAEGTSGQVDLFLDLIGRVAAHWAKPVSLSDDLDRPPVPFHVLLLESPAGTGEAS